VTPRVLVVEDEPNIRELVCLHLGLEGYACEGLADGRTALKRAESERFDLLVLDVMIPGIDGLALCRAVRNGRTNQDVPILMLTARREESDKVIGLARCSGVRGRRRRTRRCRPPTAARRSGSTASTSIRRGAAYG